MPVYRAEPWLGEKLLPELLEASTDQDIWFALPDPGHRNPGVDIPNAENFNAVPPRHPFNRRRFRETPKPINQPRAMLAEEQSRQTKRVFESENQAHLHHLPVPRYTLIKKAREHNAVDDSIPRTDRHKLMEELRLEKY